MYNNDGDVLEVMDSYFALVSTAFYIIQLHLDFPIFLLLLALAEICLLSVLLFPCTFIGDD